MITKAIKDNMRIRGFIMENIDITAVVETKELAEIMEQNPDIFYNRIFTKSTLSTYASKFLIPARQLGITRKVMGKNSADIVSRSVKGNFTFNIYEIIEWCRLGADYSACVEVLRKRISFNG